MSNPDKQPTCAERWQAHLDGTVDTLRGMDAAARGEPREEDEGEYDEDSLYEYGLSFDWKPSQGHEAGYFEWCLSWGGPADYLRFYVSRHSNGILFCDQVDYSFQDWFDGETREVGGMDGAFLREFFDTYFSDIADSNPDFYQP